METPVQVISALYALNFINSTRHWEAAMAFPRRVSHHCATFFVLVESAWVRSKAGPCLYMQINKHDRKSKLMPSGLKQIKEKTCVLAANISEFPCAHPTTEPCGAVSAAEGHHRVLMHQHRPWQTIIFVSPFRAFKPLIPIPQEATASYLLSKASPFMSPSCRG